MHKPVLRVEAHSSLAGSLGGIAQIGQGNVRQAQIEGLAFHVQAAFGDTAAPFPAQFRVGGRTSVAGDDLEGLIAAQGQLEFVQKVKELGVHPPNLSGVVVAQEPIERFQGSWNILVSGGVDDVQPLACVRMRKGQAARPGLGRKGRRGDGQSDTGYGQIGHAAEKVTT